MFVGEARNLPKSGAPERCFTEVGSGLASVAYIIGQSWQQLRAFVFISDNERNKLVCSAIT
jgi:hypothetical protein